MCIIIHADTNGNREAKDPSLIFISMSRFIAIMSSMSIESDLILSRFTEKERLSLSKRVIYQGKVSGQDIILINTGIGKVNSSHSATLILEHFPVRLVINCGIGGAYPESGLAIGDVAIASMEIYGDDGVYGPPFEDMRRIGIPLLQSGRDRYFNEFPIEKTLLKRLGPIISGSRNVKVGTFITLSSISGTPERAIELRRRFDAICENMEGAAIAHVCKIYKTPMLEIRGISNIAGIRDKRRWKPELASQNCQGFVLEVLRSL